MKKSNQSCLKASFKTGFKTISQVMFVAMMVLSLGACASSTKQAVKEDVQSMKDGPSSPQQLAGTIYQRIENHPEFTLEQKEKLRKITTETHMKNSELRSETAKLKVLLIEEVLKSEPSEKRLKTIKKQIEANQKQVLKTMFSAFDQVRTTIGNRSTATVDQRQLWQMMFLDHQQ